MQICQLKPSIIFVKQTHFGSRDTIIGDVGHLHELPYSVTNVTDVLITGCWFM
jgi:hypothetical protein